MKKRGKFKGFEKALGNPNKKTLLPETKIAGFLTMGVEFENGEIGLFLASADVSASCGFKFEEWENFVRGINEANEKLKKMFE